MLILACVEMRPVYLYLVKRSLSSRIVCRPPNLHYRILRCTMATEAGKLLTMRPKIYTSISRGADHLQAMLCKALLKVSSRRNVTFSTR